MSFNKKLALIKIFKQKSALVIDDFPDMRGSIRRMLISFGIDDVDTAHNGEDAMSKCSNKHYDIIVADYNLGDSKSGQQILEEMRFKSMLKYTSIYMMITAETTKAMVFGALEYQPDDYLTKPFTQTVLEKRLGRMVLEKEALREINKAMDQLDFDKAVELCKARIELHDKYEQRCYKIMGSCLYKKHKYSQSKATYEKVLEEREVEWAQIGMGKAQMALGELDEAEKTFDKLINNGCLCMEVYDCMADIQNRKGDPEQAQAILNKAIEISPNSILRQQKMAEICEDNGDWSEAEKAHRRVIRLGNNSVYESPEHHFKLARCISSEIKYSSTKDSKRVKDAEEVLRLCKRRYKNNKDVALQSDIISANVLASADKIEESNAKMADLESKIEASENRSASLLLDVARNYSATGKPEKAQHILKQMAERFADNEEICAAIDQLSTEPLTAKGKQKAIELNNEGKDLFAAKDYKKAVNLFSQALKHYPNNIGLNLNLMLALVRKMNADGATEKELEQCTFAKGKIAHIDDSNPLFERYKVLCDHLDKLKA
jgi:tetratricopeptide (TPR) repeat protein